MLPSGLDSDKIYAVNLSDMANRTKETENIVIIQVRRSSRQMPVEIAELSKSSGQITIKSNREMVTKKLPRRPKSRIDNTKGNPANRLRGERSTAVISALSLVCLFESN